MNKRSSRLQQSGSFHLTRKTDYGLLLLSALAKKSNQISIKKIATENKIPPSFLQKIAADLQRSHLIKSTRGKYGGHTLAKNPKDITIREVIEALEGPLAISKCTHPMKRGTCLCAANCHIRGGIGRINAELQAMLMSKTLSQLIS